MKNNIEFLTAKEKAVKFIGLCKKSTSEVKEKLLKSGFDKEIAELVVQELVTKGYLDDNDYAYSYVLQESKLMKKSKFEIKMFLLKKGIDDNIVETALYNLDDNYERKIVDKLMSSKLLNMEENKAKAYLYRRGFNVKIY